jgi:hypothetical protein
MIILMIMMKTKRRKKNKRIIHSKKAVNGHNVIDLVELLNQRHCNAAISLRLVPDPGIEGTIPPRLLQGLVLVVLVLGFLWKLLFQKALVLVRRDRKLHRDSGDLVLMLRIWELVGGIPAGLLRWIIDLPGLAVVANDVPEGKTAIMGSTAVATGIHLHRPLLH